MNKTRLMMGAAAIALVFASPVLPTALQPLSASPVMAQGGSVSVNVFFDSDTLRDSGRWVRMGGRYVFSPDVDADWEPYRNGRWVYTDRYGWYFRSSERFAWAVYHYGRWGFDRRIGWYWVPGTVWAPAWVSWRRSDDAIGWAPLPPEGDGYSVSVNVNFGEPPRGYWNYVPADRFLADDLSIVIIAEGDERDYYERTRPVGPVIIQNNIVVNTVIDIDFVQQVTNQTVNVVDVQTTADPLEAQNADAEAIVAVEGELAPPAEDAAPAEVVEPDQVEAPTAQQADQVEATEPPAEGEAAPPAEGEAAPPAEGEAAPEEPAAPAAEEPAAPAAEKPAAPAAEEPAAPAAEEPAAPAAEEPAAPAADEPAAPAEESAAPAEEPAAPAAEEPAAPAAEEPAPAEERPEAAPAEEQEAAPAEEAPEEAAPAEEEEAPAEECSAEDREAGNC